MRSIVEVINAMLVEIPTTQTAIRASLARISQSAGFTAPEVMPIRWRDAALTLDHLRDDPDTAMVERVRSIFAGTAGPGVEP